MKKAESNAILNRSGRARAIAYWVFTLPVAFENAAGSIWVLMGLDRLRVMLAHLGYPVYFKYILGPWQFACAAALLAPGLPRVKEWAYAGAFFNYSSAFISHWLAGDPPDIPSALMIVLTVLSWALRPPEERIAPPTHAGDTSVLAWVTSGAILALMLVLALFSLPHGTGLPQN